MRSIVAFASVALLGCGQSTSTSDGSSSIDAPLGVLTDAGYGILPDGAECGREGEPCCYMSYHPYRCGTGLYCNFEGTCRSVGSCSSCGPGQVCVQKWGGTCCCGFVECMTSTCTSCTAECLQQLCGGPPSVCGGFGECGGELPGSFKCYGP